MTISKEKTIEQSELSHPITKHPRERGWGGRYFLSYDRFDVTERVFESDDKNVEDSSNELLDNRNTKLNH